MEDDIYKDTFYPSDRFWRTDSCLENNYRENGFDYLEDPDPQDLQELILLAEVLESKSSSSGATSGP